MLRAVAVVVTVAIYLNLPDANVARAQSPRCLQCLSSGGCFANCNCTCSIPGTTVYIRSCNADGTANVQCQNTGVTPPV